MNEQSPFKRVLHSHWTYLIFLSFLILTVLYLFKPHTLNPHSITITIESVPDHYERAVAFFVYYDQPPYSIAPVQSLIDTFYQEHIPLTLFFTPQYNDTTENVIYNQDPFLDFPFTSLDFKDAAVGTSNYFNSPLGSLSYAQQEFLMQQAHNAYLPHNLSVNGFYPPQFSANFDTLLAAENLHYDYLLAGPLDQQPFHPDSPLGIKMHLLVFPLANTPTWQEEEGIFAIQLDHELLGYNLLSTAQFLNTLANDTTTLYTTLNDLDDLIRERERISAYITTDVRSYITDITFEELIDDVQLRVISPYTITSVNSTNQSLLLRETDSGYLIPLNTSTSTIRIYWEYS